MGLRDWRLRHALKDPVRGEFRVTGQYSAHPNGNSFRDVLTGVVTGPGITPTAGEHLADTSGRYIGHDVLPVLFDRSEPSRFVVQWDEIDKPDFRAQAREQADQAARAEQADQAARAARADQAARAARADQAARAEQADQAARAARAGSQPAQDPRAAATIELPDLVIDLTAGRVSAGDAAQLMSTGEIATAVLLAVTDVDVPRMALPGPTASLCDLALRVTRPNGDTYDTVSRLGFRSAERRASIAVIGSELPVRIDPADHTRVVVDSVAYDARHPDGN